MADFFDIIIVGGGPAGLTASIYARRAGKSVLVLEKATIGGQIASSPKVDNFPGLPGVSGAELGDRLYSQADELGVRIELEEVLEIRTGDTKTVVTDYSTYTCTALILATGTKHRSLGLKGEDTLLGIHYCAVCDGAFYKGKDVAVVGGGNTALQDALFLSDLCRQVYLIHRRDQFRGDPILVEQLKTRKNITLVLESVVEELSEASGQLSALSVKHLPSDAVSKIAVDGLFMAVGQQPESTLSTALSIADKAGYIPAGEDCLTPLPGIFVAGDCRTKEVRQLTTACGDGAVAALAACRYCG